MIERSDHTHCGQECRDARQRLLDTIALLEAEFGDGCYDPHRPDTAAPVATCILWEQTCYPMDPYVACDQAERIVAAHQARLARG